MSGDRQGRRPEGDRPLGEIGPYRLLGELGRGGMGEVYRALDPRLGREVAIKLLLAPRVDQPDALRRFEEEARAAGALNHPNVLTVFDVGHEGGQPYIVTELLEGETLRQRLDRGRLPPRLAAELGAGIARGLAAAHAAGIVHRDLKPENIFLVHDGRAKILDFGLAKLTRLPFAGEDKSAEGTLRLGTEPGVLLGTVGYMSPEQCRGEEAESRSDLFAFGTVLYEMLTGIRAFRSDTPISTLHAILTAEVPEASSRVEGLPSAYDRILERCLAKDPRRRYQSAEDLAFQLELLSENRIAPTADPLRPISAPRRQVWPWLVSAGLVGAALAAGYMLAPREPPRPVRLQPLTHSGSDRDPAVSPDGTLIAFISGRDGADRVWLKHVHSGEEVPLAATDADFPRFAPDGASVLFSRNGGLERQSVLGGEPTRLVDDAFQGDWSPDGNTLAFVRIDPDGEGAGLWTASRDGSAEKLQHTVEAGFLASPRWSPDGRWIGALTYTFTGTRPGKLVLVSRDGAVRTEALATGGQPPAFAWSGSSAVLYADPSPLKVEHALTRQPLGAPEDSITLAWIASAASSIDVLGNGEVVLGATSARASLVRVRLDGAHDPVTLTRGDVVDRQPVYSPDGATVVFTSARGGQLDVWRLDLQLGTIRRLTDHPATDWDPTFAPNGDLVWSSNREGHFEVFAADRDGRKPRRITSDGFDAENPTVTASGLVLYNSINPVGPGIWRVREGGLDAEHLVAAPTILPVLSSDERYLLWARLVGPGRGQLNLVDLSTGTQRPTGVACSVPVAASLMSDPCRARWLPGRHAFAYLDARADDIVGLFVHELGANIPDTLLYRGSPERVPESFAFAPDGKELVVSNLDLSANLLRLYDLEGVERAVGNAPLPDR